jgi:hypothetical protein
MTAAHDTKAALIDGATTRRRAELVPRADVEQALAEIHASAVRHLRGLTAAHNLRDLPPEVHEAMRREVAEALARIETAHGDALRALRTGDLAQIDVSEGK